MHGVDFEFQYKMGPTSDVNQQRITGKEWKSLYFIYYMVILLAASGFHVNKYFVQVTAVNPVAFWCSGSDAGML